MSKGKGLGLIPGPLPITRGCADGAGWAGWAGEAEDNFWFCYESATDISFQKSENTSQFGLTSQYISNIFIIHPVRQNNKVVTQA